MGSSWDGVHDLIARVKAGDGQAWGALHEMAGLYLLKQAQRLLGPSWPHESVSDLTQEAWQRTVTGIAGFEGGKDDSQTAPIFRAWMRRTLKNVHANRLRAGQAQFRNPPSGKISLDGAGPLDSSDGSPSFEPVSGERTASSILWRNERGGLIRQAIERLEDPADRELLHQVFFEGHSLRGIAARRGVTPGELRYHFDVLLKRMRDDLKDLQ